MAYGTVPAAPSGFAHRFRQAGGLRFHYVEGGRLDGPVLVLLAGFPESSYAWRRLMPLLADRFRVLAIDLPGQGDTDKPIDGYDTQTVARRLHALLEALGLDRYHLVAHDVGAWVAFPFALLFGSEIATLTLLDAGIPGITLPDTLPSAPDRSWKTWHFAFHAVPDLPERLLEGRERLYLEWFFRNKCADPTAYDAATIDEYVRVYAAPGGLRAGLGFYRAADRSATQNRALAAETRLSMPVLCLSADQGSIPDMAAAIRPFGTDVRGETIAGCGHFMPEEQPAAIADSLLRVLGGS